MRAPAARDAGPPEKPARPPWPATLLLIAAIYFFVFRLDQAGDWLDDLAAAGLNVFALLLTGWAARAAMRRWILPRKGWRAWAAHLALAATFAWAWAWLLFLVTGIWHSGSAARFSVTPFLQGPALTWQLFQGAFAYVALAAVTTLEHRPAGAVVVIDNARPAHRDRFLLRGDEEILSLAATDIVSAIGADDYAEIVTSTRRHLVPTTLEALETALDPRRFIRVHRSAIANLDHVQRAEPTGGGRMVLRMSAGPDVPVSRNGAKRLRERLL